jgi:hypothetical protein
MTTAMANDEADTADPRVTVATFGSLGEAGVARGVLASAGIESEVADEASIGVAWHLGNALGGLKLQVAARDAATAQALLSSEPPSPDAVPTASPRDRSARRAMAAALLGLATLPIIAHVYAFVLLAGLDRQPGPLSRTGRIHAAVAAIASGLALLGTVVLVVALATH